MALRRWCVPFVVVALTAVGCSRSSSTTSSSTSTTSAGTSAGGTGAGDFGTLKAVCGPGNATGATDQGVTDHDITVGTMADPGAAAQPGLDQEIFDAAEAFVDWCNAAGGILGRKLVVHKWDSKLTEVAPRMIQACQADFMLVGNGEALDATGVEQRTKCKLPEIPTYDVSVQASTAALSVEPLPNTDYASGLYAAYRHIAQADPAAAKHYAMLANQLQSIKDAAVKDRAGAEAAGFTTVYYDELPLLVDNWRPYAENIKDKGVQVFTMENSVQGTAALFKALTELAYKPKYALFNPNLYDPTFLQNAGDALNGTTVLINTGFVPFELASTHPATKQYMDLVAQYAHAKPKALGAQAWSAWLLFAESAKACGSNLTRACVLDHAKSVPEWTGGGLHAPSHPGDATGRPSECFLLVQATPSGFTVDTKLTQPNNGPFNCSPDNVKRLPGFPK
ncbi:MAG TPA: ABC transporter substrate-binding protein [Acidimicrobiia bacterium]|nr:ABC transporter substrate-binding protein [Acidimicrobiia bacterium]